MFTSQKFHEVINRSDGLTFKLLKLIFMHTNYGAPGAERIDSEILHFKKPYNMALESKNFPYYSTSLLVDLPPIYKQRFFLR